MIINFSIHTGYISSMRNKERSKRTGKRQIMPNAMLRKKRQKGLPQNMTMVKIAQRSGTVL
jgi:hypothetical protein